MNGIRRLCGTVLLMEAIVLGLAILPAIVLEHANRALAGGIGVVTSRANFFSILMVIYLSGS